MQLERVGVRPLVVDAVCVMFDLIALVVVHLVSTVFTAIFSRVEMHSLQLC